ncbi:FAR1-related sequence 5-like protein [Tanacetum coccineum]
MDDSTRHFIDEDQSTLQEVQTEDTPTHDVHDVIEYDEHDLSAYFVYASLYVDSESDNECRRPTPNGRNKAGKLRKTIIKDTLVQDNQKEVDQNEGAKKSQKNRYSSFTITDCKAVVSSSFETFTYKVRGKAIDWKNFRRSLNKYIGLRDAQMLVDKLNDRKKHVPNFSFEYKTVNDEMSRMFLADETMKCNYIAFGDVVSSDATYRTNRYRLISAHLLESTTTKIHGKEPLMVVTDQDAALRNAIEFVFPGSHHRLCMWHITQKLPGKICGDVENDSEFKKLFHKLIWNVHIGPEEFEQRWHALIGMFNLSANSWLSEMFEIRDRWIPGYFKDLPMCCLMKTTSRSESSNAFFRIHSHQGNMLVQFMLCFEAAMEKQRYTQRIADNTQKPNNEDVFQKMLGVTTPNEVVVKVPKGLRNKGCGTGDSLGQEQGDENDTSDHATSDTK